MTNRLATQATAFGLALIVTLGTLGSLNQLASSQAAQGAATEMASAEQAAVQQVVIVGKRAAQRAA
jgi:hypothetical protein